MSAGSFAPLPVWNTRAFHLFNFGVWNTQVNLALVAANNRQWVVEKHVSVPLTETLVVRSLENKFPGMLRRYDTRVSLVAETTDVGLRRLMREDPSRRVAALNFANCRQPGGGYLLGCRAQEEDLCRAIPSLYASLTASSYPFDHYEAIKYTSGLDLTRDSQQFYAPLERQDWVQCDIITSAAPDLRPNRSHDVWDEQRMRRVIDGIFRAPIVAGSSVTTLQLGAYGNGVFCNKPEDTARLFGETIRRFHGIYTDIVFSIPDEASTNFLTYQRILAPLLEQ